MLINNQTKLKNGMETIIMLLKNQIKKVKIKRAALKLVLATSTFMSSVTMINHSIDVSNTQNEAIAKEDVQKIELFYMYSYDNGTYWLDPSSEYENVIHVDYDSLKTWSIDVNSLHHGQKVTGTFDENGWDLYHIAL